MCVAGNKTGNKKCQARFLSLCLSTRYKENSMSKRTIAGAAPKSLEASATNSLASSDGIDRRGFLHCMAWAGTGIIWSFAGGIPVSSVFGATTPRQRGEDFSFVQISDSHIGFAKAANPDVTGTLQKAVD